MKMNTTSRLIIVMLSAIASVAHGWTVVEKVDPLTDERVLQAETTANSSKFNEAHRLRLILIQRKAKTIEAQTIVVQPLIALRVEYSVLGKTPDGVVRGAKELFIRFDKNEPMECKWTQSTSYKNVGSLLSDFDDGFVSSQYKTVSEKHGALIDEYPQGRRLEESWILHEAETGKIKFIAAMEDRLVVSSLIDVSDSVVFLLDRTIEPFRKNLRLVLQQLENNLSRIRKNVEDMEAVLIKKAAFKEELAERSRSVARHERDAKDRSERVVAFRRTVMSAILHAIQLPNEFTSYAVNTAIVKVRADGGLTVYKAPGTFGSDEVDQSINGAIRAATVRPPEDEVGKMFDLRISFRGREINISIDESKVRDLSLPPVDKPAFEKPQVKLELPKIQFER